MSSARHPWSAPLACRAGLALAFALAAGCSQSADEAGPRALSGADAASPTDASFDASVDVSVDASADAAGVDSQGDGASLDDVQAEDDRAADAAVVDAPGDRPVVAPATSVVWTSLNASAGLVGTRTGCRSLSFADLDDDGAPDLVFGDSGVVRVLHNDGTGVFSSWATLPVPQLWAARSRCPLAVGDFDGDGLRDVAVGFDSYTTATETGVAVLFQDAGHTFTLRTAAHDQSELVATIGPRNKVSIDVLAALWGGGRPTLLFAAEALDGAAAHADLTLCKLDARGVNIECPGPLPMPRSLAWTIDPATRDLALSDDPALQVEGNAQAVGATDFDGDGEDDLVVGMDFQPQAAMRRASGGFVDRSHSWSFDRYGHGMGVALGDVDDDGVTDAIVSTMGGVLDFRGVSGGGFRFAGDESPYMTRPRSIWPWSALLDDLDADGRLDLMVVGDYASSTLDPLRFMQSIGGPSDYEGAWTTFVVHDSDATWRELDLSYADIAAGHGRAQTFAIGDIDGDGHPELATLLLRAANHDVADLYIGRLLGGGLTQGHGLTVQLGASFAPGSRAELDCGGRTQRRRLYAAEGFGNAARTELHFGCGDAATFDELRVYPRGSVTPVVVAGGVLDRAIHVVAPGGVAASP